MTIDLRTYKKKSASESVTKDNELLFLFLQKLSDKRKEVFYRELGILLKSGIDFKKALEILSEQDNKKNEKNIIINIKNDVIQGKSICDAMINTKQFSPYEYYSVRIGEETGQLQEVLNELQKFFTRKIEMKRQIISILTYPFIVILITIVVLYFMLSKVVPMFASVFNQFGSELPKTTRYIITLSNYSAFFFMGFLILLFALIAFHFYIKNNAKYKKYTSIIVVNIPFFGKLIRKMYLARFCQSMSLLISSKTSLITSLSLVRKMIRFYPIESSIADINENITKGLSLSESLKKHKIYEQRMISMIEVAEQVNQLDSMFEKLTEQYNQEVNHQTKMIGVVLEPLIIVIIGLIVGIVMIAMYSPMFDLSKIMFK